MNGKKLTPDMIIQKAKTDKFEMIKNLNLWGNDLQDISLIRELINVEILSLSVNAIKTLADFSYCPRLTELYLRKNCISNLSEIKYLQKLPNLKVLWLVDNPCSEINNYRLIVIKYLPNLIKLDNFNITEQERDEAEQLQVNLNSPMRISLEKDIQESLGNERPIGFKNPDFEQVERVGQKATYSPKQVIEITKQQKREQFIKNESKYDKARSENLLCAVLSILKELDNESLGIIRREIERKLINT